MVGDPLLLLAILLIGIFVCTLLGAVVFRTLPGTLVGEAALGPFHGLLLLIALFACISTQGKSVQSVILLYFIFQAIGIRPEEKRVLNIKILRDQILRSFLFSVPIFCLFYLFIFRSDSRVVLPFMDEIFYSKVASYLNFRGIESNDLQCLWIDDFCAVQPYHYFEIWLTALISYFSGISTLVSYKLLAIPLLFGLACDILFQLSKSYQLSNLKAVFSVILVLTSGLFLGYQYTMDWPLPQTLKIQLHYISDFVPLNRVKLVTIFLFVCAFLFTFLKNIKFNSNFNSFPIIKIFYKLFKF